MGRQVVTISYRLGGRDGVSVEAAKWAWALRALGFRVRRVAGAFEDDLEADDLELPGLRIDGDEPVTAGAVAPAFDGADLVIVENVCSLPLNAGAARAVAAAIAGYGGRVVFRHHDLPWQRRRLRPLETEFPPRRAGALHAPINLRSRRELIARGYECVVTIHNYFDLDAPLGDRHSTRAGFGFADDEFVLFQPARAIERKNVPGGLRFAQRLESLAPDLRLRYWLSGPAEDGYGPTLERLIAAAPVPVTVGRAATVADSYAACDAVVFPSTWEGFGNPVIESIAARRPCVAARYPVLAELLASGIRVFSTDRPEALVQFLAAPEETREQYYDVNLHRARISYDIAELPAAIDRAFTEHGWRSW